MGPVADCFVDTTRLSLGIIINYIELSVVFVLYLLVFCLMQKLIYYIMNIQENLQVYLMKVKKY